MYTLRFIFSFIWYVGISYFIYLLLLITLQYLPIDFDVAFLQLKQEEIQLPYYQVAFFSHVFTSIVIIAIGLLQFIELLRIRYAALHRGLGKLYICLILFVSGPSGMVLSIHANGGIVSKVSFVILTILWIYFTYKAYTSIRERDVTSHQRFMIRSYALTLSAVSLRLFKWILSNTLELPPMDMYRMVSILGWVVNLMIAELYIWYMKSNFKVKHLFVFVF
jgi:uncharacterized membrane protein